MATKKNFTSALDPLASSIETLTAQPEQPAAQAESDPLPKEKGWRRGRNKGSKAHRINLALAPETYDFVRRISIVRGETMTDFCNHVFEAYMKDHLEEYLRILDFVDKTN